MAFIVVVSIFATFSSRSTDSGINVNDKIENVTNEQPEFPTAPIQLDNPAEEN